MAEFSKSIMYVLQNEGGLADVKEDRGRITKFGITQDTLTRWRGKPASDEDVKGLELDEAKAIYEKWFWSPLSLNEIKDQNVATALMDMAVNFGLARCSKFAQQATGVKVDGQLGPLSREAINKMPQHSFLLKFIDAVQDHYVNLVLSDDSQKVFLRGWINRSQKLFMLLG